MTNDNFKIIANGTIGGSVLASDLTAPNGVFTKCWQNFLRELDGVGIKLQNANIELAGQNKSLPVAVNAGVANGR